MALNCLIVFLKKFGIGVKFVTTTNPEDFAAAIDEKTKAIFVESIGNPKYIVADIPALAKVSALMWFMSACSSLHRSHMITRSL